jgi:propionate CoA-transferase
MRSKIVTLAEAIDLIHDGATVGSAGSGLCGVAEELLVGIENHFLTTGRPRGLTILHAAGQGDRNGGGLDHLAHEGLLRRIIGAHFELVRQLGTLVRENKIEAYNFPQGVICHLYRAIATQTPGVITKVGLGTFADPQLEGGKMNQVTVEDLVQRIELAGAQWLLYPAMPIDVALVRGTMADEFGNVTMEDEAAVSEGYALACAAKATGGKVIVQVRHLARAGSLDPRNVKIPGPLVDVVVLSEQPEKYHRQTMGTYFNPALAGQVKIPSRSIPARPLDAKKVIARRAFLELTPEAVVNLGIGTPDLVAAVAAEEGALEDIVLTVEAGQFGGMPAAGLDFGAAVNPWAMVDHASIFDFYNAGGLDFCFLGMAQVDRTGNVNVSRFGRRIAGCGGFVNISQNTKTVCFCGTFTAGGLKTAIDAGRIRILQEGTEKKFVTTVEQVTFNGSRAADSGQQVFYFTERAVFTLRDGCLTLIEVAPGIDLQRDILDQMDFRPVIADDLKQMARAIFADSPMDCRNAPCHE